MNKHILSYICSKYLDYLLAFNTPRKTGVRVRVGLYIPIVRKGDTLLEV
jgi:hypothetical protein